MRPYLPTNSWLIFFQSLKMIEKCWLNYVAMLQLLPPPHYFSEERLQIKVAYTKFNVIRDLCGMVRQI